MIQIEILAHNLNFYILMPLEVHVSKRSPGAGGINILLTSEYRFGIKILTPMDFYSSLCSRRWREGVWGGGA
jgi:hypothetical protein